MNRYRTIPGLSGPSKAGPTTICQKCLKKDTFSREFFRISKTNCPSRHYSYECKATTQERPYVSRPSRTQQFLNPRLAPRLTNDAPSDLMNRSGVADKLLAKAEDEAPPSPQRGSPSLRGSPVQTKSSARSPSLSSSNSISTISTNKSRSVSPSRDWRRHRGGESQITSQQQYTALSRSRSRSRDRKRKHSSSPDRSISRSPSRQMSRDRKNRRHRTVSPDDRGRHSYNRRGSHRSRSRSQSGDRSRIVRERRSLDEGNREEIKQAERFIDPRGARQSDRGRDRVSQDAFEHPESVRREFPRRRERSLSPYSKRLALTQAMNIPG